MNPFDSMYDGTPPWEIGRAQRAFVDLVEAGAIQGSVLDIGCGTGDLAMHLASLGHEVVGIDASERAIQRARQKAVRRGSHASFRVGNALELGALGRRFDTVVDCGLLHAIPHPLWERYRDGLEAVMRPGSTLHVLCFSDEEPDWGGPRRVRREELLAQFAGRFHVDEVRATRFEHLRGDEGARAWMASVTYIGRVVSAGN